MDWRANTLGRPFPQTIANALKRARVILAVIDSEWIRQADRLNDPKDWVRRELVSADTDPPPHFLPVYIGTGPGKLPAALPADLEFLRDANGTVWDTFGDTQKVALLQMLQPMLSGAATPGVHPQLALLCDRGDAEDLFEHALDRPPVPDRPQGWILFGEENQQHDALFQRIRHYTLERKDYPERYPVRQVFQVQVNHLARKKKLDPLRARIFSDIGTQLGGAQVANHAQLYEALRRHKVNLCVIYAVVRATSRGVAGRWLKRFARLREEFPVAAEGDPHIVLALSVAYPRRGLFSLMQHANLTRFFKDRYPSEFVDDDEDDEGGDDESDADAEAGISTLVSRLGPATEDDVKSWRDHIYVRDYIKHVDPDRFLTPFAFRKERPMATVLMHITSVIQKYASSAAASGGQA
jgi:hypothetical protein